MNQEQFNKSMQTTKNYVDENIPTKTSQLTNDSGFLTEHQDISGKANKSDIPTKTSQLTNDSDFVTNASVDEKVANAFTNEITELNILSLVLGNYQIKYNETDDTLDFLYNGVIDEPEVPPTTEGEVVSVTWIDGKTISSGNIVDNEIAMLSDPITIDNNYNYTIRHNPTTTNQVRIVFYDSSQTFISKSDFLTSGNVDTVITFPQNTAYFRIKAEKVGITVNEANDNIILKKVKK